LPDLSLFDLRHWWEFINGLVLICGLAVFILPFFFFKRSGFFANPVQTFLKLLAGYLCLLLFISNLQRGSGDWDLLAFSAPLTLLCAYLVARYASFSVRNYLLLVLAGSSLASALFWIHINHTDRSVSKIWAMLVTDPAEYYRTRISGTVQCGILYKINGLHRQAAELSYPACAEDPRACVIYGESLAALGQQPRVAQFFDSMVKVKPALPEAWTYLVEYYSQRGEALRSNEALTGLYRSFLLQPDDFLRNVHVSAANYRDYFKILYAKNIFPDSADQVQLYNVIQTLDNIAMQRQSR
jgi:hypothetical protein